MPTILRIGPFRFFFFSNEGHESLHVHVESGDKHAKFWLRPVALAHSVGYNAVELGHLRELVEEHQKLFSEKWEDYFGG